MYTLIVQNANGDQLNLTENTNYDVLEVTGTNPPPASINTVNVAGIDGSRFNSSRIGQRNIVITLDIKAPIEKNRIELYRYFKVKKYIKIYYQNENRDVYIEGYVESFENNPWSKHQRPQISIICPDPFWKAVNETNIKFSKTIGLFEFPFSIPSGGVEFSRIEKLTTVFVNFGEVAIGAIIEFHAETNQVLNPKFYNRTTNTFFGLNFDMYAGDRIIINTQQGHKSAVLMRNGVSQNLLSDRMENSSWVTFEPGENEISYDADEGSENLNVTVTAVQQFEGV